MEDGKHLVKLLDFSHLDVTGVKEVLAFDDAKIELSLGDSVLLVGGNHLRIESFSRDNGVIAITGEIDSLFSESEAQKPTGGFFSRFFS